MRENKFTKLKDLSVAEIHGERKNGTVLGLMALKNWMIIWKHWMDILWNITWNSKRYLKRIRPWSMKKINLMRMQMMDHFWSASKIGGKYFITLSLTFFYSKVYNNLFLCIKFGEEYSGYRFVGAWTEQNCGGTPLKNTEDENLRWAENPQYLIEIEKKADVFIPLASLLDITSSSSCEGSKLPRM